MVFRPIGPRVVAYGVAASLLVLTFAVGRALPDSVTFTPIELLTLAAILAACLIGLHGVARSYVAADDTGLTVVNGFRKHVIAWSDVLGIAMNAGAPWPTLVTKDDERVMLFAIQGTDGPAAREALAYIQSRIR